MTGQMLGHYRILAKIGQGGMGEVYRARDTRLDRDVALKVLPEAFTADPDRLARFEREAKLLASLNHPNIAAIHGLEDNGDTRALVLELVEGPTLADRIARGPIPVDEALPIATQIAEALEAAHEQGIIHRDLKPANIKVREDGTVKVLDFGLAKALAGEASNPDLSQSPTITATIEGTREGVILGTAAYMSPEQARGKPVDKRTDIWAFGCVLFEILGATWAGDGTIVFASGDFRETSPVSPSLWRVAALGGVPELLTTPDLDRGELGHAWPEYLPGSDAVLFTIMADAVEESIIAVLIPETGEQRIVLRGGFNPRYSPTGHIVYGRSGGLWAVPFDLDELTVVGDPVPVQPGVLTKQLGGAAFSVSRDGSLLYIAGDAQVATPGIPTTYQAGARALVWVDREGTETQIPGATSGEYRNPSVSPDGLHVTFDDGADIWTLDLMRGTATKITTDPAVDSHPIWDGDGQRIIFSSERGLSDGGLYIRAADGTGGAEPLLLAEGGLPQPTGWADAQGALVFHQRSFQASETGFNRDVGLLPLSRQAEPQMLFESELDRAWGSVSPNGRWVAYAAAQSGVLQVFVERFPAGGNRRQISNVGGDFPRWSPDGRELFFRSNGPSDRFFVVSVEEEDGITPSIPELLFSNSRYINQPGNRMYDIAPTGDRFLVSALTGGATSNEMVLVRGWLAELSELVQVQ